MCPMAGRSPQMATTLGSIRLVFSAHRHLRRRRLRRSRRQLPSHPTVDEGVISKTKGRVFRSQWNPDCGEWDGADTTLTMRSQIPAWRIAAFIASPRAPSRCAGAALMLFSLAVLLASGAAPLHAQSVLDGFDPNANEEVHAVVVQPDGKVLIGGRFTTLSPNGGPPVTRNHLARLNPDGTLDTAFNPNVAGSFVCG